MKWWVILIIVLICAVIFVPIFVAAVQQYIEEIKRWKKQRTALSEKPDPAISRQEAEKQATKEFFIAFKPYFDYLEKGDTISAKKFLDDFYATCPHRTKVCGDTIKCPECPYGGLVVMNILNTEK